MKHVIIFLILFTGFNSYGQDHQIQKNEFDDLIIKKNGDVLDCFYKSELTYSGGYSYYLNNNVIYFFGARISDMGLNGKMGMVYVFESFTIDSCSYNLRVELEKVVTKENYIEYKISDDGFLIKKKDDLEISKIHVSNINKDNIFP